MESLLFLLLLCAVASDVVLSYSLTTRGINHHHLYQHALKCSKKDLGINDDEHDITTDINVTTNDIYEVDWKDHNSAVVHSDALSMYKYSNRDGDYEGELMGYNNFHGQGKLVFYKYNDKFKGDIYEGRFKEGKLDGQGRFIYRYPKSTIANGRSTYEGSWKNNKKDGFGKMTFDCSPYIEGIWKEDNSPDQGRMTWYSDKVYVGGLRGKHRHGSGKQTWPDGRVYIGDWVNDEMHGDGRMTFANGTIYDGEFINDNFVNLIPCKE